MPSKRKIKFDWMTFMLFWFSQSTVVKFERIWSWGDINDAIYLEHFLLKYLWKCVKDHNPSSVFKRLHVICKRRLLISFTALFRIESSSRRPYLDTELQILVEYSILRGYLNVPANLSRRRCPCSNIITSVRVYSHPTETYSSCCRKLLKV